MHRTSRRGFTLMELLVVVGIIIFIVGLSIPAFSAIFKGQGAARAARTAQTAIHQARSRATSVGRQQMMVFVNDYNSTGKSAILVYDSGEDLDGSGDPWLNSAGSWEATDGEATATFYLSDGYMWDVGKTGPVGGGVPTTTLPNLPVLIMMPDGTMRVFGPTGPPYLTTQLTDALSDDFNDPAKIADNHDLEIRAKDDSSRFYMNFLRASGRARIKTETLP